MIPQIKKAGSRRIKPLPATAKYGDTEAKFKKSIDSKLVLVIRCWCKGDKKMKTTYLLCLTLGLSIGYTAYVYSEPYKFNINEPAPLIHVKDLRGQPINVKHQGELIWRPL